MIETLEPNMKQIARLGERCCTRMVTNACVLGFVVENNRIRNPSQRCRYCRTAAWADDLPTHSFVEFKAAGSRYACGKKLKEDTGCPRYEDGLDFLNANKHRWITEHVRASRDYYLPTFSGNRSGPKWLMPNKNCVTMICFNYI